MASPWTGVRHVRLGGCADAFVAYRNIAPGNGGVAVSDRGNWSADDVMLNVDSCEMVAYEFGVKGVGLHRFRLQRDAGGCPGEIVPGTEGVFLAINDEPMLARITFDPPVLLPSSNLWASIKSGNSAAVIPAGAL